MFGVRLISDIFYLVLFVLILGSTFSTAFPSEKAPLSECQRLLCPSSRDLLVAYLEELLHSGILPFAHLSRMVSRKDSIDTSFLNPISKEEAAISPEFFLHRDALEELGKKLTYQELLELKNWAQNHLMNRQQHFIERRQLSEDLKYTFPMPKFVPIVGGKYEVRRGLSSKQVFLDHDFEMMDTPVTQEQWIQKMGANPSQHVHLAPPSNVEISRMYIEGQEIHYFEARPVESVSAWEAMEYANRLSVEAGLVPAYRLSEASKRDGAFINNESQNIYATQGYRLPTDAEWEYLFLDQGKGGRVRNIVNNSGLFAKHAWTAANSNLIPQPVATREALVFGASKIFDFLGNSKIWLHIDEVLDRSAGVPFGIRGVSFESTEISLESFRLIVSRPSRQIAGVGIRLVRTTQYRSSATINRRSSRWIEWLKSYIKF